MSAPRTALSLLTYLLAASCLSPYDVFAANEPSLSFYPAQKWEVEEIAGQSASEELKTCSISNTFNNGFVVQLAGTAEGFSNLNIDFRQPTFAQNKPYEVQYSVPGGATKILPTKAFSESLLVTDLRKQDDFVKDLRTNGVVDVRIQSNEFRLYMTGIDATIQRFTKCSSPLQAVAQSIPAAVIDVKLPANVAQEELAPPPPMPDIQSVAKAREEAERAAQQPKPAAAQKPNFDRKRYTETLAQKMKQESESFAPLPDMPQNAPAPVTGRESLDEIYSGDTQNKADQTATIEPQASSPAQDNVQKVKISGAVIRESEPVRGEVDLTQIGIDNTTSQRVASAAMDDIDAQILSDIEPSSGNVTPLPDAPEAIKKIQGTPVSPAPVKTSAPANAEVSAAADAAMNDMRKKMIALEQQVENLKRENATLDSELKAVLKDSADERTSISSNNWDLERATMRYNEAELQIARLGRQLQSYRSQCDLEKAELKAMLFDPKLTDQHQLAKLSSLEDELERTKTDLVVQQRTYEERVRLLEQQLNKVQ